MVDPLTSEPDSARDLLRLEQLPGVGPVTVRRLVERFGSARSALAVSDRDFDAVAGAGRGRNRRSRDLEERVSHALRRARDMGVAIVTWGDPVYPAKLRALADPPPVLFARGRLDLLDRRPTVTIVGARRATERGRDAARRLGAALARVGIPVASGLALGVDRAAHEGALAASDDTIAVLGTGADVAYPAAHRRLFARIVERGLIVSEFVPGTRAAPHHFPRRNRILAGLSSVVVVVEAGRRSGALITVDHALDLGIDVWAVPGPIDTPGCAGSNRLLVDGARPLVSIDEFVRAVAPPRGDITPADGAVPAGDGAVAHATPSPETEHQRSRGRSAEDESGLEARVVRALHEETLDADELSERCARPVHEVLAVLTTLELHGEVERLPGLRFRRAA